MAGGGALARNALASAKEEKRGTTKVTRYRAGQVPKWAEEASDEEEGSRHASGKGAEGGEGSLVRRSDAVAAPVVVTGGRQKDRRLERLAARTTGVAAAGRRRERVTDEADASAPQQLQRRRRGGEDTDEEASDDEEAIRARRARIRSAQLQASAPKPSGEGKGAPREGAADGVGAAAAAKAEDSSEYYSSEYETDTSDDEGGAGAPKLAKPVFVSRKDRTTLQEGAGGAEANLQTTWKSTDEVLKRQQETKEILKQMAANEFQSQSDGRSLDDVDTDDEKDRAGAYEAWKGREMDRLRLEWLAQHGMTTLDLEEADVQVRAGLAGERSFMQKYYHKGAFFQSVTDGKVNASGVEEVYKKDYSAPTGDDVYLRSEKIPEIMKVRNFGKRGRTKWTHLSNEDTSRLGDDYSLKRPRQRRRDDNNHNNDFAPRADRERNQ